TTTPRSSWRRDAPSWPASRPRERRLIRARRRAGILVAPPWNDARSCVSRIEGGTMQATTTRRTLSATTLVGDGVRNTAGDSLGQIEELIIDLPTGRGAYGLLSLDGS